MEGNQHFSEHDWSYDRTSKRRLSGIARFVMGFFVTALILYGLFLFDAPFYIYKPGTAEEIGPMVEMQQTENPRDQGAFLLTTVRMSHSNLVNLGLAFFNPLAEIRWKQSVLKGKTEEEYSGKQDYVMLTSQSNAIQAAYQKAGIAYQIKSEGVIILETLSGMPADQILLPGDGIVKADETEIRTTEDLYQFFQVKKPGDTVTISYKRKQVTYQNRFVLVELPRNPNDTSGQTRAGLGVTPADVLVVKAEQESQQVNIKAGDIGGPSAGLMFALEIYNRVVPADISKGYRIAGTGTITPGGKVCPIGGIQHKVVAADRAGADIFFAPKDTYPPECGLAGITLNTTDAENQANTIRSDMKVVPVATMDEALQYLENLKPKS